MLNVLYFKAEWEKIFTSSMKGRFYVDSQSPVNVTLMRLTDQFRVSTITELDAKALEMPYKGQKVKYIAWFLNKGRCQIKQFLYFKSIFLD